MGLWVRSIISKNFIQLAKYVYGAKVETIPKSFQTINKFIANKINGNFTNLLGSDSINPLIVTVLISTVHWRGFWSLPFDPKHKEYGIFKSSSHGLQRVKFMNIKKKMDIGINVQSLGGATVVKLNFGSRMSEPNFCMFAMFPRKKLNYINDFSNGRISFTFKNRIKYCLEE